MNTEKMIPIDFPRNITPYVPGDVYYNNFVDAEFTMDQQDADGFNKADPKGEFNTYFIVSFADRPNTTGKQPVADDVVVNVIYDDDHAYPVDKNSKGSRMGKANWDLLLPISIVSWKPNHEAMLAKFKEQGANTMNEQEHKAKSHEVALMTNALDDNPDEQVIEPYVADHLKGLINPVSEGCQAGDVISVPYSELPPCNGEIPKPVFTQEMVDAGELPPIGSKALLTCGGIFDKNLKEGDEVLIGGYADFGGGNVAVFCKERGNHTGTGVSNMFKPIDNRTDKEKTSCALWDCIEQNDGDLNESSIDAFRSDLLSKFTITLNKD